MANEFEDLIKEFGSTQGKSKNLIPSTAYDDLIKQFGSSNIEIAPAPMQRELGPPIPEEAANYKPSKLEGSSATRTLKKGIKDLPSNILSSVIEDFKGGANLVGQGITDIAQSRPASGIGNVGIGLLSSVFSPVTGTAKEVIEKPVTALTGSEEIGKKAELLATMGLPITRAGKAINASRPSNAAVERLIDAIGIDNISEVLKRMKGNERLTFADVSPAARQDAQALVIQQGPHQNPLIETINKRQAGARGQVERLYDEAMGAPVDVIQKIEQLKKTARETGANVINPIVEKSKPVDVTAVVRSIDDAISSSGPVERATLKALKEGKTPTMPLSDAQSLLFNARERIRGDWKDNPQMFLDMKGEQGLHTVQMNMRREAKALLDSDNPLQHSLGQKLMNVRNQLVQAGGKDYQAALSKYADDMSVQEAFQTGQNVLRNRPTHIEDRPEYLKKWLQSAKPDEIEAMREGARVAIDNQIRSMRFAAKKGTNIPEVEFNKEKLEMLFGKKEVEQLARKLKDETDIADTTSKLLQNSQTAMRQASNARVDLPERKGSTLAALAAPLAEVAVIGSTGVPGAGLLIGGAQGAGSLIHRANTKIARKTNEEYSKLLFSEGEQRQALMNILQQRSAGGLSIGQKLQMNLPNALKSIVVNP